MPQPLTAQSPPPAKSPPSLHATASLDEVERYILDLINQHALSLATLRNCRLKGITINLESLQQ